MLLKQIVFNQSLTSGSGNGTDIALRLNSSHMLYSTDGAVEIIWEAGGQEQAAASLRLLDNGSLAIVDALDDILWQTMGKVRVRNCTNLVMQLREIQLIKVHGHLGIICFIQPTNLFCLV